MPAIILKDWEHKKITKTLNEVRDDWLREQAKNWKPGKKLGLDKEGLWEIYQVAYKENPEWLRAIKSYFD